MACLTFFVVLASCTPQATTTPISAQTQTIIPHPTITPTSANTSKLMYVSSEDMDGLKQTINEIISTKNATFGIGIYNIENQGTFFINKDQQFIMLSVVKFPQAIAILNQVDEGILNYDMGIHFEKSDLQPNTYSPLRDERTEDNFDISLSEALSGSLA
jgi:beta-lactamase class A